MIFPDNDRAHFEIYYSGYMELFEKFDMELRKINNAELSIRIRDSVHNDCIVLSLIDKDTKSFLNPSGSLQEVFAEFEYKVRNSCSNCGQSPASYISDSFRYNYEVDRMKLCDECKFSFGKETDILTSSSKMYFARIPPFNFEEKLKKVRYIDPMNNFGYAKFGEYFFIEDNLFIISEKPEMKMFDRRSGMELYKRGIFVPNTKFVIKALYAGQKTGFQSYEGSELYTGDIVQAKGSTDTKNNLWDDRTGPVEYNFIGVVCSDPAYNRSINYPYPKLYKVSYDHYGHQLSNDANYEVLGNIFYSGREIKKLDIWEEACRLVRNFNNEIGLNFSNNQETVEALKNLKYPS